MDLASQVPSDLLARHRAFWTRGPTARALRGRSRAGAFFLAPLLAAGLRGEGRIEPRDVPPPADFARQLRVSAQPGVLDGDLFAVIGAPRALPWMEAIAGCPVLLSVEAGTVTAKAALAPDAPLAAPQPAAAWQDLLERYTRALAVADVRAGLPMAHTLLRGPSDVLMAMLGAQRFCLELVDHPAEMMRLTEHCASLWIETLKSQYRALPPFAGGYFAGVLGLWAPGPGAVFQEDATSFISARAYRRFFMPSDEAIADAFDFSLIHLHSTGLHILEAVLEIAALDAINIVVDPSGPTLPELLPVFRKVQARKALHVHGTFSEAEVETLAGQLDPAGLCLWAVKED